MNKKLINAKPINMKKWIKVILIGFFAGVISGFFGAGGGLMLIPFLIHALKMDDVKARASTVFCILFMVVTSSIFYLKSNYIDFVIAFKCAIRRYYRWIYWFKIIN